MGIKAILEIEAECEDCGKRELSRHTGGFLGIDVDEHEEIQELVLRLELDGWDVGRASYEEIELRCPKCKAKRAAA